MRCVIPEAEPSSIPRLAVAVQPALWNWADEVAAAGHVQVVGRGMALEKSVLVSEAGCRAYQFLVRIGPLGQAMVVLVVWRERIRIGLISGGWWSAHGTDQRAHRRTEDS